MTRILDPRWLGALLAAGVLAGCAQLEPLFETKQQRDHKNAVRREAEREHSRAVRRDSARSESRSEARTESRAEAQADRDAVALREGIRLYNEGDFNGAIRRLGSNDIRSGAPLRTRLMALKYTAFSYCVTSRPKQCEEAFERALKLDPNFTLESGEQGHPLWGPAFERAKRG
ncbi:TssQ family T6SS-associated lipoprotein [Massilia niabensis]|uniref:TssQ family T6SS-associated lipoprotein n=1 Tax=Massilia niabensis TaxID=544910 RepID=A0ABW0LCT9_9BURK